MPRRSTAAEAVHLRRTANRRPHRQHAIGLARRRGRRRAASTQRLPSRSRARSSDRGAPPSRNRSLQVPQRHRARFPVRTRARPRPIPSRAARSLPRRPGERCGAGPACSSTIPRARRPTGRPTRLSPRGVDGVGQGGRRPYRVARGHPDHQKAVLARPARHGAHVDGGSRRRPSEDHAARRPHEFSDDADLCSHRRGDPGRLRRAIPAVACRAVRPKRLAQRPASDVLVGQPGLEPETNRLRVYCSTN
jgi:hypothetical protein